MAFLGLTELLILLLLPTLALLIGAFVMALVAFRRVKRLERRMDDADPTRPLRP